MNNDPDSRTRAVELTREAADWFVRISSGTLSEHEVAQWLKWVGVEQNAAEFARIRSISVGVESLRSKLLVPREEFSALESLPSDVEVVDRLKSAAHSLTGALECARRDKSCSN